MSDVAEHWRAVVGFEGLYEVSSLGRVRSIDRIVQRDGSRGLRKVGTARFKGRVLALKRGTDGYPGVTLYRARKGTYRNVHRLVCEAFHGPCPAGHEAGHSDGQRTNCAASNLAWVTPVENAAQKRLHASQRARLYAATGDDAAGLAIIRSLRSQP